MSTVVMSAGLGLLGLLVGSFLNVVISRVPEGLSVVTPPSRCPKCSHRLSWFENIPVLSWIVLRGRCRRCSAGISFQYPLVEILTGVLYLACGRRFGWSGELALALAVVSLLVPLTFIDLQHWILPFTLTLPGIGAGLGGALWLGPSSRVWDALLGAALGFFGFWALEWLGAKIFRKEALGGGDKYLLALIGAFLSHRALLGVVFLASFQGALVGLVLLWVTGRAGPVASSDRTESPPGSKAEDEEDDWVPGPTNIPFGPWLSLAAIELLLLGPFLGRVLPEPLGVYLTGWTG